VNLLLDTHIWLWALEQNRRLALVVRKQLENPRNRLFVSPVSVWEAGNLHKHGRIKSGAFHEWLDESLEALAVVEAPFTVAIAREASRLRLPQPDFGDIMLAATALVEGLVLVTVDQQLLDCKWLRTLANG